MNAWIVAIVSEVAENCRLFWNGKTYSVNREDAKWYNHKPTGKQLPMTPPGFTSHVLHFADHNI